MRGERGTQSRVFSMGDGTPPSEYPLKRTYRPARSTIAWSDRQPTTQEHDASSTQPHSQQSTFNTRRRRPGMGFILLVTLLALLSHTAQANFLKAPVIEGYIIPKPTLSYPDLSFNFANGTHLSFKLEPFTSIVSPTSQFKENGRVRGEIHANHAYKAGKSAGFVLRDSRVEGFFKLGDTTSWQIKPLTKYCRIREPEDFLPVQCKLLGPESESLHFLYPVGRPTHHFFSSNEAIGAFPRTTSPLSNRALPPATDFCNLDTKRGEEILQRRIGDVPQHLLMKRAESGCPTRKKALYMGFAMDCTYVERYGSASRARDQVLLNMMQVTEIFDTTFNVQIGVLEIEAFTNCQNEDLSQPSFDKRCTSSYTISDRLSDFSQWRGTKSENSGLWHLMSTCATGSTVGLAWLNTLCETTAYEQQFSDGSTEWVSGTAISTATTNEYLVVAHEIGHNFGAVHDCASFDSCGSNSSCCSCASGGSSDCDCGGQYIMNPTSDIQTATFSPCSQSMVCRKSPFLATCFEEPGTRTVISNAVCGNGRVEGDEECDCGGVQGCAAHPCCNADCTLKPLARCSDDNHSCCQNCQILAASSNRVCRASIGECDITETCDGTNKDCPTDRVITDGTDCADPSGGTCSEGVCTTRKKQCEAQANSQSGREVDVITGDCPIYRGQCQMFCESTLFGCRAYQSFFSNGTRCGNSGLCVNDQCTEPDTSESNSFNAATAGSPTTTRKNTITPKVRTATTSDEPEFTFSASTTTTRDSTAASVPATITMTSRFTTRTTTRTTPIYTSTTRSSVTSSATPTQSVSSRTPEDEFGWPSSTSSATSTQSEASRTTADEFGWPSSTTSGSSSTRPTSTEDQTGGSTGTFTTTNAAISPTSSLARNSNGTAANSTSTTVSGASRGTSPTSFLILYLFLLALFCLPY